MKTLKTLAIVTSITVYALIAIGGYVTGAGEGLSGGTDWPIPKDGIYPTPVSFAEYLHRAWTIVVSIFIVLTAVVAWKAKKETGLSVPLAATLALVLLVIQVPLGMVVLKSGLHAVVVTFHLSIATGIFGATLATAVLTLNKTQKIRASKKNEF